MPLKVPSYLHVERCSSSGPTTHRRTAAAQTHGRGRRKSHRYVGVNPAPLSECGIIATSTSASSFSWSLPHHQQVGVSSNEPARSACTSPSTRARSGTGALSQLLFSLSLTESRKKQSDDAARKLLHALQLGRADSPVGRLLLSCCAPSSSSTRSPGDFAHTPFAVLGQLSRADVAAAALLLPSLTWQWLSVADLEGWVDRGVAQLLRETLLVQKAATDASASINELVGWCLDNCSGPATALAALWGQQQARALPPRSRSFYGLMLRRLGLTSEGTSLEGLGAEALAAAVEGPQPAAAAAVVMCGSVTRTAVPTSSRRRSTEDLAEEAGSDYEEGGPGGSSSCSRGCSRNGKGAGALGAVSDAGPAEVAPDTVVLAELPAAAGALLKQPGAGGGKQEEVEAATAPQLNGAAVVNGSGASAANGYSNGRAASGAGLRGVTSSSVAAVDAAASPDAAADTAATEAVEARATLDAAEEAPTAPDTASPGAVIRPTASLLQRPARSPAAAPEPELDPGAEDATSSSGSPAWYFRGGASGPQQSYSAVRLVATGRFPLRDLSGKPLAGGLTVPETGPVVISNDPRVFAGSEAVLSDYVTAAGDKLAMRLEYVVDRSWYDEVVLQLFNISRVTRKRTENCMMYVNGKPVNVGDPGVALTAGDEVWFGNRSFAFRVEALPGPPSAVQEALRRFCGDAADESVAVVADPATAASGTQGGGPRFDSATSVDGYASDGGEMSSDEQGLSSPSSSVASRRSSTSWSSTLSSEPDMAELSNLSRREPMRAEAALRRLAAANPRDAAVWLIWAQTAARLEGPGGQAKARLLFRAAVEAARRMEVIPPPPAALQVVAQRARGRGGASRRGPPAGGGSATASGDDGGAGDGAAASAGATAAVPPQLQRHNWLLVQALGNWGKHEWRLRMYGSARHLFRAAVDEAARHPDGVGGGGGAAILHYWASRELDALNVRNARIVAAEALRKCPADVALYVLAAGVELEGGNLELAKSYCQRAYSLDRTDKQLFLVWPRVEAALGDRLKARLLYERALDMYPLNTKILNLYARFEVEEGSYREAAELYDRALRIDPLSPVMGVHNRADWASLEADLGNTALARGLLEGGLEAHPRSTPLLVTLAKVERLEGRYPEALRLVRAAQSIAGPFNAAVMTERSQVLRALGEREMAANLSRHVGAVKELNRMKQQGYWGSEAWRTYIEATRSPEQQALVAAARQRKLQLGWAPAARGAKPRPTGAAGDGRRPAAPEAQQWMQLEQLRARRAEARRLAAQRAARVREMEEGGAAGAGPLGAVGGGSASSSGDDEYYNDYYDEQPVGVPSLDSVRRPMPGEDDDVYDP